MTLLDLSTAQWRKSSRSSPTANCVEVAFLSEEAWRKSSWSTDTNCVEVAFGGRAVGVRDSKNVGGPVLAFPLHAWQAFTRSRT